jgi:hypothetical protein
VKIGANQNDFGKTLQEDPGDRDYFSICPTCSAKVLETGLEKEIS